MMQHILFPCLESMAYNSGKLLFPNIPNISQYQQPKGSLPLFRNIPYKQFSGGFY